jgi:hypothetical protein
VLWFAVTAYAGAATVLKSKDFLAAAAGILAVEAYHMGMARSTLYRKGEEAWKAANAVSDARDKIDGSEDKDQGIQVDGKANIVPSTPDAIAFTRTPREARPGWSPAISDIRGAARIALTSEMRRAKRSRGPAMFA